LLIFLRQEKLIEKKTRLSKIGDKINNIPNIKVYYVNENGTEKYDKI